MECALGLFHVDVRCLSTSRQMGRVDRIGDAPIVSGNAVWLTVSSPGSTTCLV